LQVAASAPLRTALDPEKKYLIRNLTAPANQRAGQKMELFLEALTPSNQYAFVNAKLLRGNG